MKERVVVAMSGGVDSSVAAALLKKEGYEVIGITMCFNLSDVYHSFQGIEDARRVCHKLGIKHYVLNMEKDLEKYVIKNFIYEYLKGRTPNPCVRCNRFIKFGALLERIKEFDAQYLATGHYGKIEKHFLKKGRDRQKDQSYFLYPIKRESLSKILFPLGKFKKEEVRDMAKRIDLPVKEKLASQEICFIPDADYRKFLRHRLTPLDSEHLTGLTQINRDIKPGPILDKKGNVLGEHKGICFYTIGQRKNLNIKNRPGPFYVISINPKRNEIIVGNKEDTKSYGLIAKDLNFISIDFPKKKLFLKAKIRYNHKETESEISPLNNKRVKVIFKEPVISVCPGQSVVFYDKDIVVGGGIIERSLNNWR